MAWVHIPVARGKNVKIDLNFLRSTPGHFVYTQTNTCFARVIQIWLAENISWCNVISNTNCHDKW